MGIVGERGRGIVERAGEERVEEEGEEDVVLGDIKDSSGVVSPSPCLLLRGGEA